MLSNFWAWTKMYFVVLFCTYDYTFDYMVKHNFRVRFKD